MIKLAKDWSSLDVRVVDPAETSLVRLFSHANGEWDPPPPEFRNLRVDPPEGEKDSFAVLYTSTRLDTIAQECGVLWVDSADKWHLDSTRESSYSLARYTLSRGGIFIPVDGRNGGAFGFEDDENFGDYSSYQQVGSDLFNKFSHFAHGICWRSFHRHANAQVYAIWHSRKADLGLRVVSITKLESDPSWIELKSRLSVVSLISP